MTSLLKQFTRREAGPIVQFIKYGICGGAATFVHMILFYALATLLFPAVSPNDPAAGVLRYIGLPVAEVADALRARNAMISTAIAFIFSNLTAYLLNIVWVFQPGRHHPVVEIVFFYAVSGISMVIGTFLLGVLIHSFGFTTSTAFIANLVTCTLINFAMRKFVIFKG